MTRAIGSIASIILLCSIGCASDEPADSPQCLGERCDELGDGSFEYIVVGSGAGGGPLAARLARMGHRVLLLEAGSDVVDKGDRVADRTYSVPFFSPAASEHEDLSWSYVVEHYDDADRESADKLVEDADGTKGIFYPRGTGLGGSTAVNALITVAPHDSDWDRIAEATGDDSWRPERMRPHFDRVVRQRYGDHDDDIGWLSTEMFTLGISEFLAALHHVDIGAFQSIMSALSALTGAGGLDRDVNDPAVGAGAEGVFRIPLAMEGGARNGTRELVLDTIASGHPLTLRLGSFVTNVIYAGDPAGGTCDEACRTVVGVEFVSGDHIYRADRNADPGAAMPDKIRAVASREVIVSAGAFNTPQILKLSGIGPRAELESLGIDVRSDLPGVGRNLQDRYEVGVVFETKANIFGQSPELIRRSCSLDPNDHDDPCLSQWQKEGTGILTGSPMGIIKRSFEARQNGLDPDLFMFGLPALFRGYYPGYSRDFTAARSLWTWLILKAHTGNKGGTVTLRSADPRDKPDIRFRYFGDGDSDPAHTTDLEAVAEGVEMVREIQSNASSALLGFEEIWPGPGVHGDELDAWIKSESWGHHACCTAKIGPDDDPMAVLDSRFRVRGVEGLRVVDASIFPDIPGFFIATPIYMASEKAADMIHEDAEGRID